MLVSVVCASAAADVRYVGGGRYLCNDKSAACAIVKQNNQAQTEREIEARRTHPYVNPDPTFSAPREYWSESTTPGHLKGHLTPENRHEGERR
jgi:hypothetical protein